jgi:large subunit ribosomal protein L9
MEIILLEKVENVGVLGDKVSVRSGFARNFLIPQGKAVFASAANVAEFEARRAELEKQAADKLAAAESRKAQIEALADGVTVTHKAGDEGKLFGSVGTSDIVAACEAAGIEIAKSEVRMPEGAFRSAGDYDVVLHLHTDVNVNLLVKVVAED